MSPRYERQSDASVASGSKVEFDLSAVGAEDLDGMSIDELRILARLLDVPDRATITDQDKLITAIRQRL